MKNADEIIGRNVTRFRRERSQKDVAQAMRERGWKWSQATVWSIEKGERPLRLAEADDLAVVLECWPRDFTRSDKSARLRIAMGEVSRLFNQFDTLLENYTMALWELAMRADEVGDELEERDQKGVTDWLKHTPSILLRDASARAIIRDKAQAQMDNVGFAISEEREAELRAEATTYQGKFQKMLIESLDTDG